MDSNSFRSDAFAAQQHLSVSAVEFDRVREKIEKDLAKPLAISEDVQLRAMRQVGFEIDSAALRHGPDHFHGICKRIAHQHWLGRQGQTARFDSGNIEDFVDQAEQVLPTLENMADALLGPCVEVGQLQDLREAQD